MAGNCWKWINMATNRRNKWTCLEMAGYGLDLLEMAVMAKNDWNGQ